MVTLVIVDRYLHNIKSVNFYRIEETFETVGKTLILAFLKLSDVQNRLEKKLLVITFYNQVRAPTYRVSEFCFEIFSEPILWVNIIKISSELMRRNPSSQDTEQRSFTINISNLILLFLFKNASLSIITFIFKCHIEHKVGLIGTLIGYFPI